MKNNHLPKRALDAVVTQTLLSKEVILIGDVSMTELLQKFGKALGKPARSIPVPVGLMTFVAKLVAKADVAFGRMAQVGRRTEYFRVLDFL